MNNIFPRDAFEKVAEARGHSKEFILSALEYADKLIKSELPVLFSTKHFCEVIDITYGELKKIILNRTNQYGNFKIRKKSGGFREIRSPKEKLKNIQKWILNNILSKVSPHGSCIGFKKGDSIIKNALPHLGKEAILKFDLFHFFDTVTEKRVYSIFKSLGYHSNLAVDLAKLCTVPSFPSHKKKFLENFNISDNPFPFDSFLPQGAPTSPALANLVAGHMDKRFKGLADFLGLDYSRYADDLTFSGNYECLPNVNFVKKIILEEGFYINESKTCLRREGQQRKVTGIIVSGDTSKVPKAYKKDIWKHLYFLNKFGVKKHLRNIKNNKSSFQDWLLGRIMFVRSVEFEEGNRMLYKYNQVNWPFYE
ncbi:reverse transcriptase family protein [Bacillus toyonensis]|uniref:reverse transcriptase family protein n=1 Tax=Bacillus toyonensis TaxID=155322 RepID=UPI001EDD3B46|nr:reverse transcriptase family protein [Bacillus toyonensis]MCG3797041.1 reverse transcriptase family protein [Bacillus toyonensis]